MRILSIATTHPRWEGDSEPAFVFNLNRELVRLGHKVTTVLPHAAGARREEVVDGVRLRRFRYFLPESRQRLCYDGGTLPNLRKRWSARLNLPFFLVAQCFAIARELRSDSYDLIHCHWLIPQGFFAAFISRWKKVPLVVTAHGGDVYTRSSLFRCLNRAVLRRCSRPTVVSSRVDQQVKSLVPGVSTETISMGVNVSAFSPDRRSTSLRERIGGEPQLLFVGRLAEKKGTVYLLRAMPMVVRRFPKAKLALIGSGPEEDAIRREIKELGLETHVVQLGKVAQERMPNYMASADVFVMPSVVAASGDTEGLPVVLMEALASGTPVVCSDVGGVSDLIKHGETGLLAREKDAADLGRQCIAMLDDEVLRKATAERGRALVEQRFSWPTVALAFEAVFHDCVSGDWGK